MKIYSGKLHVVGAGTVRHSKMGTATTTRSVIEIGNHTLRNVRTSNFIESYLDTGKEMDLLIARFLWMKAVYGVRSEGRSHMIGGSQLYGEAVVGLFLAIVLAAILSSEVPTGGFFLGVVLVVWVIIRRIRAIRQYHRFENNS
ncbi:hypothetical protein [Marinoscillum sp.]|uniref:hypothetical protein n=1 Tax=Marinoscillum sp. TaxID=2024838 RepID=UPI003BAACD13